MFIVILSSLFLIASTFTSTFAVVPEKVIEDYENIPPTINYYPYSTFSFEDDRIKWTPSNNLRRKTGSSFVAIGEQLFVEGYVKDINGVPIDGVTVLMIHSN